MTQTEYKKIVDAALEESFKGALSLPLAGLAEAMRYSLLAGGKRIRPILVLEFCRICGGSIEKALPVACAIEMLHTYSLIHDDLPCMDNDTLRRGRPTNHVVYGECTATLAGDALQAEAFGTILRSELASDRKAKCAAYLADAVGLDGMCGGQFLDMLGEGKELSEQELMDINSRKTGALLTAACRMGVIAAGGDKALLAAAERYALNVGMAFQIRDDVLDQRSTAELLGKPIGSDESRGKPTFVSLMGLERAEEAIEAHTRRAIEASACFPQPDFLAWLAQMLAGRDR